MPISTNPSLAWLARLQCTALALCIPHSLTAQEPAPTAPPASTAPPATAQTPTATAAAPPSLHALLEQLAKTDNAAWLARKEAVVGAAKQARAQAAQLRTDGETKQMAAATESAAASVLDTEIKKLAELRAALAQLTFCDPVAQGDAKEGAQAKLELALAGLRSLPTAAWEARTTAMQELANRHRQTAKDLLANAQTCTDQAKQQDEVASTLDAELAKLEALQQLIGKLDVGVLSMATAASPTVANTAAAASAPTADKPTTPAATPAKEPPSEPAKPKPDASAPTGTMSAMPTEMGKVAVEADHDLITYEDHVYPIFDEHCITCHEPSDASGGLDLSSHAAAMQGGGSGRTLNPGNPDQSRLYLLVSHQEKPTMPPKKERIDKELIETIRKWIQQGAPNKLADAKQLAKVRAAAREKALLEEQNQPEASATKVVMPESLPMVTKAYPPRPGTMRTVAASPGAPLLAIPGFHQVLLLHQDTLQELGVLDFPFGQVESLSFAHDGSVLVAAGGIAGKSGGAVLFDVRSGREVARFGMQGEALLSAAVSPNGTLVAIGDTRRKVTVLQVPDAHSVWQESQEDWVTALAFSADGKWLASADRQGFVTVREAGTGREVHAFKAADGLMADLAFAPNSESLACAGADRTVSLYRMSDGRQLFRQQKHSDQVLCLAWCSSRNLVSSGADGRILHWTSSGQNEKELPRLSDWVYGIASNTDGSTIYAADWLGQLSAVDVKSRKVVATLTPLTVTQ